jgi:hypothetical protein
MTTVSIRNFNRGIKNDPRSSAFRTLTNLDVFTDPKRALPYSDSETGDSGASTNKIANFCIALGASSTWRLFGLGIDTGAIAQVFQKEGLTTGGANDLDDAGWSETANNVSASGTCDFNLFVYYKKTGYIYGARSARYIWRYDPTGAGGWADTHADLTAFTNISQGLVHSKDDILYIGYDNKIAKNDNGSWTVAALTLPNHLYVTSLSEFGNYLAIACAPLSGVGNSVVYLWDRDATLTTLSESIDWGEGVLKVLDQVDGILIGISAQTDSTRTLKRVTFRYYNGTSAIQFEELTSTATTTLNIDKQRVNNRLYFLLATTINGVVREGVWSVTKAADRFVLTHERTPNNDTPMSSGVLNGFIVVGDFIFISYQTGSAYAMSKTNDQASYTHTSAVETAINLDMPEEHKALQKKLYTAGVSCDPLPSGGQIVLKYRANGGSWVTIDTFTTTGETLFERTRAVAAHYSNAREYELKAELTGGASLTGIHYKYEPLETAL